MTMILFKNTRLNHSLNLKLLNLINFKSYGPKLLGILGGPLLLRQFLMKKTIHTLRMISKMDDIFLK